MDFYGPGFVVTILNIIEEWIVVVLILNNIYQYNSMTVHHMIQTIRTKNMKLNNQLWNDQFTADLKTHTG